MPPSAPSKSNIGNLSYAVNRRINNKALRCRAMNSVSNTILDHPVLLGSKAAFFFSFKKYKKLLRQFFMRPFRKQCRQFVRLGTPHPNNKALQCSARKLPTKRDPSNGLPHFSVTPGWLESNAKKKNNKKTVSLFFEKSVKSRSLHNLEIVNMLCHKLHIVRISETKKFC